MSPWRHLVIFQIWRDARVGSWNQFLKISNYLKTCSISFPGAECLSLHFEFLNFVSFLYPVMDCFILKFICLSPLCENTISGNERSLSNLSMYHQQNLAHLSILTHVSNSPAVHTLEPIGILQKLQSNLVNIQKNSQTG